MKLSTVQVHRRLMELEVELSADFRKGDEFAGSLLKFTRSQRERAEAELNRQPAACESLPLFREEE